MKQVKISLITPVYNGEQYIERCIKSVKSQNYENYEHIIVDGKSTDKTIEIVNKYIGTYPIKLISEHDSGMYDAICKGFSIATGDIFCWLNSDDAYMPWAFQVMNYCVQKGAKWVTGMPAYQNSESIVYSIIKDHPYNQKWIEKGYYGTAIRIIQQESTFWTRELWKRIDSETFRRFKIAGDFWLWQQFAKYEPLYNVETVIGCFRNRPGQLSENQEVYYKETGVSLSDSQKKRIRLANRLYMQLYLRIFPSNRHVLVLPKEIGCEEK